MKVLKYNEFIEEGFMTRSLNRSKSTDKRIENKFTEEDLQEFYLKIHEFVPKYNLGRTVSKQYKRVLLDHYTKPVVDYVKQHGTLDLGTTKGSKSKLPDFEYQFEIPELKNVIVSVKYVDKDKEIKVTCGNNPYEFDISDTEIGHWLITHFDTNIQDILIENPQLLELNIKKNWDLFSKLFYDFVYESCYKELKKMVVKKLKLPNVTFDWMLDDKDQSDEFGKFYIERIDNKKDKIYFWDNVEMKDNQLIEDILNISKEAYDICLSDIKFKYDCEL